MLDIAQLAKRMEMTTSDFDSEALTALRKANEMLTQNKLTWTEVLKLAQATVNNGAPPDQEEVDWDAVITRILTSKPWLEDKWVTFLSSVREFYRTRGHLTPRQIDKVRKFMG